MKSPFDSQIRKMMKDVLQLQNQFNVRGRHIEFFSKNNPEIMFVTTYLNNNGIKYTLGEEKSGNFSIGVCIKDYTKLISQLKSDRASHDDSPKMIQKNNRLSFR